MSETKKLQAIDVKNEVNRIKKLPKDEQERQMDALYNKLKLEVDNHYDIVNSLDKAELIEEDTRISKALRELKWKWQWKLAKYVNNKSFAWIRTDEFVEKYGIDVNAHKGVSTAHISGLPLPEHAEVNIFWQEKELFFRSPAIRFSLPVERVLGMGTTSQMTADALGGHNTYLTIEYKKEDEIKAIVVRVTYEALVSGLIRYFNKIKGAREIIKQEL